jgi:hypothetical protein
VNLLDENILLDGLQFWQRNRVENAFQDLRIP